jgi:hypothetical protein
VPIEVHIYPDPLLVAAEMDLAADMIDTEEGPMLDSLGILMASIDRAFARQGPGWEPWTLSYAKSRGEAHGPLLDQETILMRTLVMAGSVEDPANYDVTHDSIAWTGAAAPDYTDYHLTGTSKMAERNFLRIDAIAKALIGEAWTEWLGRKIKVVKG